MEVLVAIESSPNSFKALERAVSIVKNEGGNLTVITIAEMLWVLRRYLITKLSTKNFLHCQQKLSIRQKSIAQRKKLRLNTRYLKGNLLRTRS